MDTTQTQPDTGMQTPEVTDAAPQTAAVSNTVILNEEGVGSQAGT